MAVRGLGCPVRFALTAGQKGDAPQAEALLAGLPAAVVMADAAYDSDAVRETVAHKRALAVIPDNPSRTRKHPVDAHLYAMRSLIACCFSKLKQFRRVATRYEKTARNFLALVTGAAIVLWLRQVSTEPRAKSHPATPGAPLRLFDVTRYLHHRTSPSGWMLL